MPTLVTLFARDGAGGERDLGSGAIAGIIIGIIVVALLLLAVLVWRIYTFRTNRDFFNGRTLALYPGQFHPHGHVRSTRGRHDSTMDMDTDDVDLRDDDALRGQHRAVQRRQHHIAVDDGYDEKDLIENTFDDPSSSAPRRETSYPSETNRASWWWRPNKRAGDGSDLAAVDGEDMNEVQSEIMASEHGSTSAHNSAQAHIERDGR